MLFLSSAFFFKINFIEKILSGLQLKRQRVWTQIRPDILSGLIWVQTVCKSYQQTTPEGKELNQHVQLSSGTTGLIVGKGHHLLPHFVYASSKGSGKAAHLDRLEGSGKVAHLDRLEKSSKAAHLDRLEESSKNVHLDRLEGSGKAAHLDMLKGSGKAAHLNKPEGSSKAAHLDRLEGSGKLPI